MGIGHEDYVSAPTFESFGGLIEGSEYKSLTPMETYDYSVTTGRGRILALTGLVEMVDSNDQFKTGIIIDGMVDSSITLDSLYLYPYQYWLNAPYVLSSVDMESGKCVLRSQGIITFNSSLGVRFQNNSLVNDMVFSVIAWYQST